MLQLGYIEFASVESSLLSLCSDASAASFPQPRSLKEAQELWGKVFHAYRPIATNHSSILLSDLSSCLLASIEKRGGLGKEFDMYMLHQWARSRRHSTSSCSSIPDLFSSPEFNDLTPELHARLIDEVLDGIEGSEYIAGVNYPFHSNGESIF